VIKAQAENETIKINNLLDRSQGGRPESGNDS
jgi:hypothetical protein